ncbi:MMPL family transporter [Actinomadura madurae]|uniref:Putative drug exporter of the RND superfamily n=1 Tax=Actinomadura madurae TaxID=1993 RepID=A0A1I5I2S1_9ACTN|nr:MMPL family transporter [Actinomadura madurae]SFO54331.1 putative drug exporter of the RND superfamily [Actinomadura madurae]SPT58011.1 Putative membrane protein ydgH [Actinomadura madurae]
MATLLYKLGDFSARRWPTMLVGWLLLLGVVAGLGVSFGGTLQDSDSIPGSPAEAALTKMERHWPEPAGTPGQIVFQAPSGRTLAESGLRKSLETTLEATGHVDGVVGVGNPLEDGEVSKDGRTAVADVLFDAKLEGDAANTTLLAVKDAGGEARAAGLTTVYGGDAYATEPSLLGPTELVGLGVALAVLVITFGSLLAAGLPLITAIVGVVTTMLGIGGLASVFTISDNAPTLAVMLGLAVGIDYTLLIVSRHRAQLANGIPVRESVARATATAGSAVVFAGATVIIALAGLSVAGVPMLTSMGLASAGAVAVAVLVALTLVPALLRVSGRRLIPKPGSRAARRAVRDGGKSTLGVRWTRGVLRRPLLTMILGTAALVVMAIPAAELKLALTDEGSSPTTASSRQAYDMVSDAFGPGANGPLVVLVEDDDPATVQSTATAVAKKLKGIDGIADVSGIDTAEGKKAARIQIIPTTGPRTQATSDLVSELRDQMRSIAGSQGGYVAVTGLTAVSIDVSAKLSSALLPFAVVVIGLSLLLLMVAFRSIAVPIKATVGFLMSVGASFGAVVAVFQWGWLADPLGVPSLGPVASFVPIIIMAVLFGLAMDYEVFLVSAMRDDYARRRDARDAIIVGAGNASRVVTSAAIIMVSVFVGFFFSHDIDIMPIAFALGFGVLIDAFLVRMTLVPAALALLGARAWWLPRRLDRILPHVDVEGENVKAPAGPVQEVHGREPATR